MSTMSLAKRITWKQRRECQMALAIQKSTGVPVLDVQTILCCQQVHDP